MTGKGLDKDSFILLTVQEVDYEGEKKKFSPGSMYFEA